MSNLFATKPDLDPKFPRLVELWKSPSGFQVPKDPDANLQWRADLVEAAEHDKDLQEDLVTACSKDILFFVNAFCFTLRVFEPGEAGHNQQAIHKHIPFVTWEIQDAHILSIEDHINKGRDHLTDKSRDMGATWNHIVTYVHRFLFRDDESHLMISRKEDAVDLLGGQPKNYPFGMLADPGTLFGKIDYILSRLPEWMLPRMNRKAMHLVNLSNRTRIDGESSNATAGSSDRRTSVLLDEMAKMKEGESIKRSLRDVAPCLLPVSTPNGAGTAYSKWRNSGAIDVFILPWWEHPEKGAGRYIETDKMNRHRVRSPWYDQEAGTASIQGKRTPKEVSIELDMDHVGSGDTYFEANLVEEHRVKFGRDPVRVLTVNWQPKMADEDVVKAIRRCSYEKVKVTRTGGPLRIWKHLDKGRLDQSVSYTLAIDISKGQAASNSVIAIINDRTKEIVGEWADANTPPYELARIACAVAVWVGGRSKRPLIIWENNGDPGMDFGRQLVKVFRYPVIYFDRVAGTVGEKKGKRYGWRSTPEKKSTALGILRRAIAHGAVTIHSRECLGECLTYVRYDGGGIGPAELINESDNARKAHGDRVIAAMLALVGSDLAPQFRKAQRVAPALSPAGRMKMYLEKRKKFKRKNTFNFENKHGR